jgi:beta-hydroxylase
LIKWIIIGAFLACVLFVHLRGCVRHRLSRQITDHSTFMAPINILMYAFSRVPTTPFVTPDLFPELAPLRERWREIRDEALHLRELEKIKASDTYNDVGFNSFFRRGWKRFYLKWYDEAHPSASALCPVTTGLLRGIPSVKAAMFTELPPGSYLHPHRDPFAGSLRLHIGLETPNDDGCYIIVDGERYSWRDGESVMFDETYIHTAKNETQAQRVILFCDVERPMKYRWVQALNRWVGRNLVAAAASPNEEGDKIGGINRAFKYFYTVRLRAKSLRKRNKRLYYALKWSILLVIVALIFMI